MFTERAQALEAIRDLAQNFNECSDGLKGDRSFILDAVKLAGSLLEFVRSDFQNDEEIVFEAVKQNNKAMAFASDRLKSDQAFVKSLIDEGFYVLDNVSNELCSDESIVLAHVRTHCDSIKHASLGLRIRNLEITKAAMHGSNLTNLEMAKTLFQNGSIIIELKYEDKSISAKKAAAELVFLHNKVFNGRYKIQLLTYLLRTINRNGNCDALIKAAFAALNKDITIENMYKLLPLEDFDLFNGIYNIYLRELFTNNDVYPGNEEKITDYATDYLDDFPRCFNTNKMAFHKLSFDWNIGDPVSMKAYQQMLMLEIYHPFEERKLTKNDIKVLDDQKLKYCNQALIYGFKMHTLNVLYAKDPKSPLIKILLTTFNEEEKTKSAYKKWVRLFEVPSPISVPDVPIFNTSNIGGDERPSKYLRRDQALEDIGFITQNFNECINELKDDRSFILEAVKLVGDELEFAISDFQNDEEIVFAAVKQNNKAMAFASDRLKSDQAFVKSLIDEGFYVLDNVSNELCSDESIVLEHVRRHCDSIRHASLGLSSSNLEITKAAMHGSNLTNPEMAKTLFLNGSMIIDFEYENKNISAKQAVADFIGLHNKVYKGRCEIELLFYLLITINRNGDYDAVTKEASTALNIDLANIAVAKKLFATGSSIIEYKYKNKDISAKQAAADIRQLHKKVFNGYYTVALLAYLSKKINMNGDCDALIKEAFAALNIDITIGNMYKLLPYESFNLFNDIYNIYLRELFINNDVYPGNEEKITDYATDYLDDFPRCFNTNKMAFHKHSSGRDIGTPVSRKAHRETLGINNHLHTLNQNGLAFQEHILIMNDLEVLDAQKLKSCNQALIYGFKMHTLDVLYAKDPKSPLIKKLLTTFDEEEKTKSKYNEWVRSFGRTSPISVSMFGNESKEVESTDIDLNKGA